MTKSEFITQVAAGCGLELSRKDAEAVVDATFKTIADSVRKDDRFAYPGFGTFTVRERPARSGRNPQTGDKIKIEASKSVGFKPAPGLRSSL